MPSRKLVTAQNLFHGTEARFRPRADGTVSSATRRRVLRALCPVGFGCCCLGSPASGPSVLSITLAEPIFDGCEVVAYRLPEPEEGLL